MDIHVLQGEREMAAYNKTLGRFQLSGIAPAPRGVPQIEVTFDIDANGIVNVSAKDLGTGKEQKIVIQSTTNLSEDEIEKAVKEAEKFAEEDKKRKEEVEVKNNADSLVYQTEKTLKELGDKISADEKQKIEDKLAKLKKELEGNNTQDIKKATEELNESFHAISQKMYEQAAQQAQAEDSQEGKTPQEDDNIVDADYKVVDEDEDK